ncbi:MAG: hypothetical protein ACR2RB_18830 [Gammaproteobacteria bacterium]
MHRWFLLLLACLAHEAMAYPPSLRVARYSSVEVLADPSTVNLLQAIVVGDFPEHVQTVGDAVEFVLAGSGYRHIAYASDTVPALMTLPLPANHRSLGAMPLSRLLRILAGPAYTVIIDRAHRLIALEPCPYERRRALP